MKLNEKYNKEQFLDWLEELLPDFERDIKKVDVPSSFGDVNLIESLGKTSIGVMVFAIQMEFDPTRRRISITKDSFNILKNYSVQNAIIAYFCPDFGQWRLSLLTSTATWEDGRVISKLSNLKRQSFVLGVGAKTKTPTKYLAGRVNSLADLKKRFSIEVVNKDFYKEISTAFNSLQSVLQVPSKEAKSQTNLEFSVRLIGRIIFCWFLREKRSEAGISLISDKVLSLQAVKSSKDYYHKLLEPLFFEVLNKPLESRNFDEFDKEPFTQTPYLNGGLFSAQYDDYYERGRNDFQSKYHNTLVIPNNWIESLFDILETYHFTIDENTSYDEELSIDPEMLGRIFENLLAEINPDTGESARKSTGSYYTPRVIVDYMVDESLALYLKNKTNIDEDKIRAVISYDLDDDQTKPLTEEEKVKIIDSLGKLKILDPACGSGAFPMGVLQKIVFILQQIDPNAEVMHSMDLKQTPPEFRRHIQEEFSAGNYDYLRKLRVIRECIYGVDIQPIATEISRLRCFLTLVVDQAIKDDRPDRGIKPLPNLDFKFVTANTLIGLPKVDSTSPSLFDDFKLIDELKQVRDDYFNSYGIEREKLKNDFSEKQNDLINELIEKHDYVGYSKADLTRSLTSWKPFKHITTEWFDAEWMFGVKDGFDMIIANPPYVGEKSHKELFDVLRKSPLGKQFGKGKMDLFYYFFHHGINNLKDGGTLSFITTNYYPTADGAISLRRDFYNRTNVVELINFNEYKIFESALGQHNMITLLQKEGPKDNFLTSETFVTITGGPNSEEIVKILNHTCEECVYGNISRSKLYEGNNYYLRFVSGKTETDQLLEKLYLSGKPLIEFANTNEGLHTGLDSVSDKDLLKTKNKAITKGEEIFVVTKGRYGFGHLHPWFKGSDIKHYVANTESNYEVIYYDNDTHPEKDELNHLSKFRDLLEKRVAIKRANRPWYQLNWPRKQSMFEGQKIVNPYRSLNNYFALVNTPWYASADVFFTQTKNSELISNEVLTAILNSKLVLFWLKHRGKRKGKILEIKSIPIGQIPIVLPEEDDKKKLESYVKQILEVKKNDSDADISIHQNHIDRLVYKVYGLNDIEIKIVENSLA